MMPSTLTLEDAARRVWDVLVVGAGPAGALAAREAARRSASVLVVDKEAFPRRKVCGGCFNQVALETLRAVGLNELPGQLGAQPIHELWLAAGRWRATLPLPAGVAVSRDVFDAALVERTVQAGAQFLPQTEAALEAVGAEVRTVTLRQGARRCAVTARVVLAADGLGGRLLQREKGLPLSIARRSRIGVGMMIESAPQAYRPGTIFMACGKGGYVGLVRLGDGRLDVAAALDAEVVRAMRGPGQVVARVLENVGLPALDGVVEGAWRGTPPLTCRRAGVSAERLFVIGDAAGYVEPFTGEGIAWALVCGAAVVPLALQAARQWEPSLMARWHHCQRRLIGHRQRLCRLVTGALRRTAVTQLAISLLSRVPELAAPLIRQMNTAPLLAP